MVKMREKVSLKDIIGIINTEEVEGRFQEILSTQKIKDTRTGKEFHGMIDTELLKIINNIDEINCKQEKQIDELMENNALLCDIIDGFRAYRILKDKGWYE